MLALTKIGLRNELEKVLKQACAERFDHLARTGWITLTDKSEKFPGGVTKNFANGKEFGTVFAVGMLMKLDKWIEDLPERK